MHDHNNNNGDNNDGHKSMMWMMVICCLLPVVVLFGGVEFFRSIGYSGIGIGIVGIFLAVYFSKAWRAKHHHEGDHQNIENPNHKKNHKDKDCCH